MRTILAVLIGAALLMATGCAAPEPAPTAVGTAALMTSTAPSSTRMPVSAKVPPSASSTAVTVPWNSAGVRSVDGESQAAVRPPLPTNLPPCAGSDFSLLPSSGRTTSNSSGFSTTTFVVRFGGRTACSMSSGIFIVTLTAADGTVVPVDSGSTGPMRAPLRIGPGQMVFGDIDWSVRTGRPHPTQLTFDLGDPPSVGSISVPVADVRTPLQPTDPSPENAGQTTASGVLTSAADPATVATLTTAVTAPATVKRHSKLLYEVTLTNVTDTAVSLSKCPQFVEELTVKTPDSLISAGERGPLNCAHLPPTVAAHSSVTLQMELDTARLVPGPGQLTWYLLDHGQGAMAPVTVR